VGKVGSKNVLWVPKLRSTCVALSLSLSLSSLSLSPLQTTKTKEY